MKIRKFLHTVVLIISHVFVLIKIEKQSVKNITNFIDILTCCYLSCCI